MAVLLSGAFLGAKRGFYSQLLYLGMGAAGVPVFASVADGTFGVLSLIGPTGGYLLAFPVAAFIVGKMLESRRGFGYTAMAFISGEILILVAGTLFLNTFYIHDIARSVVLGAGVFSVWTAAKLTVVSGIYYGYHRINK
jgi:biotin transport system substrate-specific component